jgi:hypothetical protein
MGSAPRDVEGIPVLWFTPIDERHCPTRACRHIGVSGLLGPAAGLLICGQDESWVYLHSCDGDWVPFTDTWHESVEDAMRQAEFEYSGVSATWQRHD